MRNVFEIACKDLRLLSRDRMAMFFMVALPILMGVLFGLMYQGIGQPPSGGIQVVVVDLDRSPMSQQLIENLRQQDSLEIMLADSETARGRIRSRQAVGVIEIPAGFGETAGIFWERQQVALRLGRDPSRAAEAAMLEGFLMEAAGKLMAARFQDTSYFRQLLAQQRQDLARDEQTPVLTKLMVQQLFGTLDSLFDHLDQLAAAEESGPGGAGFEFQLVQLETFDAFQLPATTVGGPQAKIRSGWDISFPAAILWGVMGSAAGFAMSLVRERSRGTLLRLQSAPVAAWQIILGKGLSCFLTTVAVVVMMIGLGLVLGMRPSSPDLLAVSIVLVAFCFVGIMMAMSTLGKSEEAVGGAGWAINMVMAMFGGAMMPLAFMPAFMQTLSDFSPVKWSIVSLEAAIWRNYTLAEMLFPWSVLLAIGSVGFCLGLLLFQRQLSARS